MASFRVIPSIEQLLRRPGLTRAVERHGHAAVTDVARAAAGELRDAMAAGRGAPGSAADAGAWIEQRVHDVLAGQLAVSLRRVINATGVVIHTNLGRAPLAAETLQSASRVAAGYSNLEYDLAAGTRGSRHVHAERLLCQLTGAEAAIVVNNNAAAMLLVLAALAGGREVIVSRGELVEIGGGFRVPEILAQSGATLREVGTTNRTRVADYGAAIGQRTAAILRVHPSNFKIDGFTERPALGDLAVLAHKFGLPLFEDLGSGWLGVDRHASVGDEPAAIDSLGSGADIVAFSGDKLLGGPQAGLIVGRRELLDPVRRHPLMRALRVDKLTYAALESTLALWVQAPLRSHIPVYGMVTATPEQIDVRARAAAASLRHVAGLRCAIVDGVSAIGGGSAPGVALPTRLLALDADGLSAAALEARLRGGEPPVIARIEDDRVVIDLRTVAKEEEEELVRAIGSATDVKADRNRP